MLTDANVNYEGSHNFSISDWSSVNITFMVENNIFLHVLYKFIYVK